jgi:hypothetical protein
MSTYTYFLMNKRILNKLSLVSIIIVSSSLALPINLEGTINATAFASRNSQGFVLPGLGLVDLGEFRKAPIAISGDNVYITWPTNETGNDEVVFRASTDGGSTFADKINLSNSTNSDSQDVEMAADGGNVVVTWWERNATSNEPVLRMSTDNGQTFGPMLMLSNNGTIGSSNNTE